MKDYLSLVAPNQRFYFNSTKDVLYDSILRKKRGAGASGSAGAASASTADAPFSLSKFSQAWEVLGKYAADLLGQPWRKEFREIRVSALNTLALLFFLSFFFCKKKEKKRRTVFSELSQISSHLKSRRKSERTATKFLVVLSPEGLALSSFSWLRSVNIDSMYLCS